MSGPTTDNGWNAGALKALKDVQKELGLSDNYSLAPAGLTWTAEYDQAGLVIHGQGGAAAATTIAQGDQPVLRSFNVEAKS